MNKHNVSYGAFLLLSSFLLPQCMLNIYSMNSLQSVYQAFYVLAESMFMAVCFSTCWHDVFVVVVFQDSNII